MIVLHQEISTRYTWRERDRTHGRNNVMPYTRKRWAYRLHGILTWSAHKGRWRTCKSRCEERPNSSTSENPLHPNLGDIPANPWVPEWYASQKNAPLLRRTNCHILCQQSALTTKRNRCLLFFQTTNARSSGVRNLAVAGKSTKTRRRMSPQGPPR